jgi:hypothetical protein
MKRIVPFVLAAVLATALGTTAAPSADAQIVYCNACCTPYGACAMVNVVPCGNACVCPGPAYGSAC